MAVARNSRLIDRCAVATGIRIDIRRHGVHNHRVRSGRQVDGQAGHGKGEGADVYSDLGPER